MGYIDNNLMPGEEVIYRGSVHWAVYLKGAVLVALGAGVFSLENVSRMFQGVAVLGGAMLGLFGIAFFIRGAVQQATTDLALTSRRIISKSGLIWRELLDMNFTKIESVLVDQSILGGLLGYGTLIVNGVGGSRAAVVDIKAPQAFRQKALELLDAAQSGPAPQAK